MLPLQTRLSRQKWNLNVTPDLKCSVTANATHDTTDIRSPMDLVLDLNIELDLDMYLDSDLDPDPDPDRDLDSNPDPQPSLVGCLLLLIYFLYEFLMTIYCFLDTRFTHTAGPVEDAVMLIDQQIKRHRGFGFHCHRHFRADFRADFQTNL